MNTRIDRQESHWRNSVQEALIDLCIVMNPAEQITFGSCTYSELVSYARGLLDKEEAHLTNQPGGPAALKLE